MKKKFILNQFSKHIEKPPKPLDFCSAIGKVTCSTTLESGEKIVFVNDHQILCIFDNITKKLGLAKDIMDVLEGHKVKALKNFGQNNDFIGLMRVRPDGRVCVHILLTDSFVQVGRMNDPKESLASRLEARTTPKQISIANTFDRLLCGGKDIKKASERYLFAALPNQNTLYWMGPLGTLNSIEIIETVIEQSSQEMVVSKKQQLFNLFSGRNPNEKQNASSSKYKLEQKYGLVEGVVSIAEHKGNIYYLSKDNSLSTLTSPIPYPLRSSFSDLLSTPHGLLLIGIDLNSDGDNKAVLKLLLLGGTLCRRRRSATSVRLAHNRPWISSICMHMKKIVSNKRNLTTCIVGGRGIGLMVFVIRKDMVFYTGLCVPGYGSRL